MPGQPSHIPVLLAEALEFLAPRAGETVLDVTLGLGGHAEAFLRATSPDGQLIAIDADEENIVSAKKRLAPFSNRLIIHHRNFKDLPKLLPLKADIVFADFGLSSPHVDDPSRGFTFRTSAPLDLRYDRSRGDTGAQFLSNATVDQITSVLREYGEVDRAKQLATKLHEKFSVTSALGTTNDVKACVEDVFSYKAPSVLPQVFQALRIAVNDELGAVETLLRLLPDIVRVGGRVGIISYHSLEDRLVKNAFRHLCMVNKDELTGQNLHEPSWELLTKKPIVPSEAEMKRNPRSRSAKYRVLRRLAE